MSSSPRQPSPVAFYISPPRYLPYLPHKPARMRLYAHAYTRTHAQCSGQFEISPLETPCGTEERAREGPGAHPTSIIYFWPQPNEWTSQAPHFLFWWPERADSGWWNAKQQNRGQVPGRCFWKPPSAAARKSTRTSIFFPQPSFKGTLVPPMRLF